MPDPDFRAFRDPIVARTLRPLLGVLAVLYGGFTLLTQWPGQTAAPAHMTWLWSSSSVAMAIGAMAWPRIAPPPRHAHAVLSVLAVIVLVNSTALIHLAGQAFFGFSYVVAVLGFSVLALSLPWFTTLLTVVAASWATVIPSLRGDPYLWPMTVVLTTAAALAVLNQALRVRQARETAALRRQERLAEEQRLRTALQRHELEQLRSLDAFKNRFLNNAAHELGTPLTPIKVQLHLMRSRLQSADEAQRESLDLLERNVGRLEDHVRQLLDAARLQAASLGLNPARLDLRRLLAGAVAEVQGKADAAGLSLALDEGPDETVEADEHRLRDVLGHLLDNAIKFTPRGGTIRVSSEHQPNGVRIRIQDTGVGLTPEQLQRIFQPYEQQHMDADMARAGVGLGLYISRAIVQLHGGQLWARSLGPGKGSEFMVDLPMSPPTRPDVVPTERPSNS